MSFKSIIVATYGSSIFKETTKLQEIQCKTVTAKNQLTFLKRCIHHKIIPKFLQIKSPLLSRRATNITKEHRRNLLIATKNDTKERYFKHVENVHKLKQKLKDKLSEEHYDVLIRITDSSKEKKFILTKEKLKTKFELLYVSIYKRPFKKDTIVPQLVKNCVLNLDGSEIPKNQLEVLNLGPKFAVTPKFIPYMDIITITEVEALT